MKMVIGASSELDIPVIDGDFQVSKAGVHSAGTRRETELL